MKNIAYIGLGSNKGDKVNYLRKAVEKIAKKFGEESILAGEVV